jgi:hypothetical protein
LPTGALSGINAVPFSNIRISGSTSATARPNPFLLRGLVAAFQNSTMFWRVSFGIDEVGRMRH